MMKKILSIVLLFAIIQVNAQSVQTTHQAVTIAAMKAYFGKDNRIHVIANNTDYIICSPCTTDEATVYAGAGGRKWKKQIPGSITADSLVDGSTNKAFTATEKTKLAGIAAGASNARENHTGTQPQSSVTDLVPDLAAKASNASVALKLNTSDTSFYRALDRAYALGLANARILYADSTTMLAAYLAELQRLSDSIENAVAVIPIDEFPTLGSENPNTSGSTRSKLDSASIAIGQKLSTSDTAAMGTRERANWVAAIIAERIAAATLTNKRITSRIGTAASSSTPTPSADSHDQYNITALAAGATFAAPTGTPTDGQALLIRIKDNGTARTLAWNAIYRASTDLALPTTTTISKTMYVQYVYNSADTKWDLTGLTNGF